MNAASSSPCMRHQDGHISSRISSVRANWLHASSAMPSVITTARDWQGLGIWRVEGECCRSTATTNTRSCHRSARHNTPLLRACVLQLLEKARTCRWIPLTTTCKKGEEVAAIKARKGAAGNSVVGAGQKGAT